jgi:Ca2+-dependent lipid-binding protein
MAALKGLLLFMCAVIATIACYAAGMVMGWLIGIVGFIVMMLCFIGIVLGLVWEGIKEYLEFRSEQNRPEE